MVHQGDRGGFGAAAWRTGGPGEPERGERTEERTEGRAPRGELNARTLRPCRPEGKLYE